MGLVMAVPSRGPVRVEWAINSTSIAMPMSYSTAWKIVVNEEVGHARNMCVAQAQKQKAEFIFFLDDDVLVPQHALRRLVHTMQMNPSWDLITGVYVTKTDVPEPLIFSPEGTTRGTYWDWEFNTIFPISACGMGCCLIRMTAFDKVEEPWFLWRHTVNGSVHGTEGEDVYFCRKLLEAGGTLMCDGGVLCGHIDQAGRIFSLPIESPPLANADLSGNVVLG